MAMKLYTYPGNVKAQKSLIAALYNGVAIQVPTNFEMGKDNKSPEFLALNPNGKVPLLETPEGAVFESNAIFRYVLRSSLATSLYGATPLQAAQVDQWIDWSACELELAVAAWVYPILGFANFDFRAQQKAETDIKAALKVLDQYLLTRTFLVGESVTGADIAVAMALVNPSKMVFDAAFRAPFPNVFRWFATCINQPEFLAVIGEVEMCTEAKSAKPAKKEQPKKEKKPQQPKAEKKPKKKEPEEEEEEAAPMPKKAPNPLDMLPKSSFILDEWKRQYSNLDWKDAKKWLWENFDKEGYCLYIAKYQHPDDFEFLFNASNLCGGFIQRLDLVRKYGFGSMNVVGAAKPWNVYIAWMFRGDGIPQEMKNCDDSEHYDWTKVDLNNAEQVKMWEELCAVEGDFFNTPATESQDWKPFK